MSLEEFQQFIIKELIRASYTYMLVSIFFPVATIGFFIWSITASTYTNVIPEATIIILAFGIFLSSICIYLFIKSRDPLTHGLYLLLFIEQEKLILIRITRSYNSYNFYFTRKGKRSSVKSLFIRNKEKAFLLVNYLQKFYPDLMGR